MHDDMTAREAVAESLAAAREQLANGLDEPAAAAFVLEAADAAPGHRIVPAREPIVFPDDPSNAR